MGKRLIIKGADFHLSRLDQVAPVPTPPSSENNYNLPSGSFLWSESSRTRISIPLDGIGQDGSGTIQLSVRSGVQAQVSCGLCYVWSSTEKATELTEVFSFTQSHPTSSFIPTGNQQRIVLSINGAWSDESDVINVMEHLSFYITTGSKTYNYINGYLY